MRREHPHLRQGEADCRQWKAVYKALRWKFGIRQEYAEMSLCRSVDVGALHCLRGAGQHARLALSNLYVHAYAERILL